MTFTQNTAKVQELGWKESKKLSKCLVWPDRLCPQGSDQLMPRRASLRGGPGCLTLPLCIREAVLVVRCVGPIWTSVNENLHGI